ncbi:MAG: PadR family transcriptional regulator [Chitinophagales bacterium]
MYSKELLKGTLRTIVLKLLAEQGRMYGYQITQEVKLRTKDQIVLTEGALYPILHKLEAEGFLATEKVYIGKRLRKYYHLTDTGGVAAVAKVQEFADFVKTMQGLLEFKLDMT